MSTDTRPVWQTLYRHPLPVITTMPRGRTVKDRCPQCFIIPAGNGVCGCC